MIILFGLWEGIRDIWEHKLRSSLTLIGVALGVGALLTLFGLTGGMVVALRENLEQTGNTQKILVTAGPPPPNQMDIADQSPGLTYADITAIRKSQSPLIAWVAPTVSFSPTIIYKNRKTSTWFYGCDKEMLQRERLQVIRGRYISDLDLLLQNRVAVVGSTVAARLWDHPEDEAVGSVITIQDTQFTVIGLFPRYISEGQRRLEEQGIEEKNAARRKERGKDPNRRYDPWPWKNYIVDIPITTMYSTFKSTSVDAQGVDWGPDLTLSDFEVGLYSPDDMETVGNLLRSILLQTHHGIEDFQIQLFQDEVRHVKKSILAARVTGGLIASIGLIVGGMGIMNIMMASIMDRIREIGIRRAVGATPVHIFSQVMMESILLSGIGGVVGIFLGLGILKFLITISPIDTRISFGVVELMISFGSAVVVGILAGLFPAIKAARLSVVESLLFE